MDSLNWYTIDTKEVDRLFKKYALTKSAEIREKIILMHQDFVKVVAQKFLSRGVTFETLVSIGNIGLIKAVDRYNLNRDAKFTTYAYALIRGEIRNYLRDRTWQVKLPKKIREHFYPIKKAIDALSHRLMRSPTIPEISMELNLPEDLILEIIDAEQTRFLLSIDVPPDYKNYENGTSFDTEWVGAEDKELRRVINKVDLDFAMSKLTKRQQVVIVLYYYQELTQQEIANRLGVSQMQVSRLQRQALAILKKHLNDE